MRTLENIEQLKYSQTTLRIINETNRKLRDLLKLKMFVKASKINVYHIQLISGFGWINNPILPFKKIYFQNI